MPQGVSKRALLAGPSTYPSPPPATVLNASSGADLSNAIVVGIRHVDVPERATAIPRTSNRCLSRGRIGALGNVYVADTYNDRIRKIAPDGSVSTSCGGDRIRRRAGE